MICKKCNCQVPDDAAFCTNCGSIIEEEEIEATGLLIDDEPLPDTSVMPDFQNRGSAAADNAYNAGASNAANSNVNTAYSNPFYNQSAQQGDVYQNQTNTQQGAAYQNQAYAQPGYNNAYQNAQGYNTAAAAYTQQAPVEKLTAWGYYTKFWKNYTNFSGRARRAEFWSVILVNCLLMILASMLAAIIGVVAGDEEIAAIILVGLMSIYLLAAIVPSLALNVRRLHDTGKEWYWLFISLIPYVGSIVLLVFYCKDSQPGPNQFGPNPKGM